MPADRKDREDQDRLGFAALFDVPPAAAAEPAGEDASWPVVGHAAAVALLRRSLTNGWLSHAYLMEGPPQIGKTTLARVFAQALNCTASAGAPCGRCRSCLLIGRGVHPDVRTIELLSPEAETAAEGASEEDKYVEQKTRISIEDIRDLRRDAALLPYEGRYKVYIIVGAENLSYQADDALLKTLEEPPGHVLLMLTTTDARLLPETVISRCQPVRMGLVAGADIERDLVARWGVKAEDASRLARISGGRIGWAIEVAGDPGVLEDRRQALGWMVSLPRATRQQRFAWADELAGDFRKSRAKVATVLQYWTSWWRDLILLQVGCDDLLTNVDFESELQEQAAHFTLAHARAGLVAVEEAEMHLRANVNARLALEAMMLSLPRIP